MKPINRRSFILTAIAAAGCSRFDNDAALRRAAQFLWAQQAADGGFHSSTYGLLRSGQSLTPFVLNTLLDLPEYVLPRPGAAVDRALSFIRQNTSADGTLGRMDDSAADYPNYATALAVSAIVKARRTGLEAVMAAMVKQLRTQQFSDANGWKKDDTAYGGWGMGGEIHHPPDAGHVDLSMTRCVLEALAASGVPPSDPVMKRALVYLDRSQNADGGFYFSAVNPEINKAGEMEGGFTSYGTATADGILALRASGISDQDTRVQRAIQWLKTHHLPDRVPGFPAGPRESWASGLRFYYAAAAGRCIPELTMDLPPQGEDGSFRNPVNLVKEDDPLIATTFAVAAKLRR
jgi:hypothetical protein